MGRKHWENGYGTWEIVQKEDPNYGLIMSFSGMEFYLSTVLLYILRKICVECKMQKKSRIL